MCELARKREAVGEGRVTIGLSVGKSTCLSDSTIADDDTLDCLHLVLNSSVAAATKSGGQAEWRAEGCSDGGQGWSKRSPHGQGASRVVSIYCYIPGLVVVATARSMARKWQSGDNATEMVLLRAQPAAAAPPQLTP